MICLYRLVLLVIILCTQLFAQAPVVKTTYGSIKGGLNDGVNEFLGIPFASPPTGNLRWKAPVEPIFRQDTLLTQAFKSVCIQKKFSFGNDTDYTIKGSEDCLYLNVWSPTLDSTAHLPVLVFIHGGGNQQGGASDSGLGTQIYHGKNMAGRGNAVVVTIQYRLGPLGFMVHRGLEAENNSHVSGNYGVLDQIRALQWVKQNIRHFGGDTAKTMVFGESAGGLNTGNLLTSPLAAGLFTRACIQSACPMISVYDSGLAYSTTFVNNFIPSGTDSVKISYMRSVSADSIIGRVSPNIVNGIIQQNWQTVVDHYVFPDLPDNVFLAGLHNRVPLLIGSNSDEFSPAAPKTVTPAMVTVFFTKVPEQFRMSGLALYPPGSNNTEAHESYVQILTDAQFTTTVRRTARTVANSQSEPVWRYFYSHAQFLVSSLGAYHGSELFYVFNNYENSPLARGVFFTVQDDSVQNNILKYWVNFAQTGNPNGTDLPNWPQYSAGSDCYMEIKATPDGGQCGLRTAKSDYWDSVYYFYKGSVHTQSNAIIPGQVMPGSLTISSNIFNSNIRIYLHSPGDVVFKPGRDALAVYDVTGRLVADFSDKVIRGEVEWHTASQSTGCYIVSASLNGKKLNKMVTLCK